MVLAGQIEGVARYCESDLLNSYRVWLSLRAVPRIHYRTGVRLERGTDLRLRSQTKDGKFAVERVAWDRERYGDTELM
jgi:hypothetical protein